MKLISGLAAVALAATTLAQPLFVPGAIASTPAEAAGFAGDWIAGQLTDGVVIGDYGPDAGSGIDAGLALEAVGRDSDAQKVATGLTSLLVSENDPYTFGYVKSSEYDYPADKDPVYLGEGYYANATAKAAAFVERLGGDATSRYPEINLLDQLETLTDDTTGRISDDSTYPTDYANSIGQAFAVEALVAADSPEAAAATDMLLGRQCDAGFFPLGLDGACPASELYPDVTALALISLVQSGLDSAAVASAIERAADWLESIQLPDGSFPGDGGAAGANANGTGLAGWALGLAGHPAAAAEAAAWVRALQVADAGACVSQAPNGAIAFNTGDYAAARTEGIGTKRTTWRFATFQATPVLGWAPTAAAPLSISTPATAAGGATVTATVAGLAAGEHGCVSLGSTARSVKGTGAPVTADFTLPAGAGSYTFTVTTLTGSTTSTTTVAAPPTATSTPTPVATPTATPTPTPAAAPATGDLRAAKVEQVKRHRFRLGVACRGDEACKGTLVVRTKRAFEDAGGTVRRLVVARATYAVEPGARSTVVLKVRGAVRAALKSGRVRVVAAQSASGAPTDRSAFWLKRA